MRIIGEIDNAKYKISVFKSGEKTIIQIEDGLNEQLYKFRDGQCVFDLDSAKEFVTEQFLNGVESIFDDMAKLKTETIKNLIHNTEQDLPLII